MNQETKNPIFLFCSRFSMLPNACNSEADSWDMGGADGKSRVVAEVRLVQCSCSGWPTWNGIQSLYDVYRRRESQLRDAKGIVAARMIARRLDSGMCIWADFIYLLFSRGQEQGWFCLAIGQFVRSESDHFDLGVLSFLSLVGGLLGLLHLLLPRLSPFSQAFGLQIQWKLNTLTSKPS